MRSRRTGGLAELAQRKKPTAHKKAVPLLITDLPRLTLEHLAEALAEGVRWHAVLPLTQEQQMAQCQALIGLRQMQWHVDQALGKDYSPLVYLSKRGESK